MYVHNQKVCRLASEVGEMDFGGGLLMNMRTGSSNPVAGFLGLAFAVLHVSRIDWPRSFGSDRAVAMLLGLNVFASPGET